MCGCLEEVQWAMYGRHPSVIVAAVVQRVLEKQYGRSNKRGERRRQSRRRR